MACSGFLSVVVLTVGADPPPPTVGEVGLGDDGTDADSLLYVTTTRLPVLVAAGLVAADAINDAVSTGIASTVVLVCGDDAAGASAGTAATETLGAADAGLDVSSDAGSDGIGSMVSRVVGRPSGAGTEGFGAVTVATAPPLAGLGAATTAGLGAAGAGAGGLVA